MRALKGFQMENITVMNLPAKTPYIVRALPPARQFVLTIGP
jgi:hypothetical protein